jgi:hypothetical protein
VKKGYRVRRLVVSAESKATVTCSCWKGKQATRSRFLAGNESRAAAAAEDTAGGSCQRSALDLDDPQRPSPAAGEAVMTT